jgi:hypothetical protein
MKVKTLLRSQLLLQNYLCAVTFEFSEKNYN